ncbi:MAG: hypothetical protein HKN27_09395 [Silicimonas sp.]|nr:hypothetical protein [Silicimonas sp.]
MINRFTDRFSNKEDGGISVEAVLAFPLLIWAITATFVFFDAFKSLHISQKATYTVADMLSRETDAIDSDYLTAMHELFVYLSQDDEGTSSIRFSVVQHGLDPDGNEETTMVWSEGIGGAEGHVDMAEIGDRIPEMVIGDQLIVVETEHDWAPGFAVGLASYRFREVSVARPRFAPQLVYDNGNNGNGNGNGGGNGSGGGNGNGNG